MQEKIKCRRIFNNHLTKTWGAVMGTSIVAKSKYQITPQVANNKNTKSLDYDMRGCHEDNYCCKSREYGEEGEAEPIQNLESANIIVRYFKRLDCSHHSCKLPISFNSRSLVIFAHLVSHNLDKYIDSNTDKAWQINKYK